MNVAVIPPINFRKPPFYYPPLDILSSKVSGEVDCALVIVEDESRWQLDEAAFRMILDRRLPVAFFDPHDYHFYLKTDEEILSESWFGAKRSPEIHGLHRVRRLLRDVEDAGIPHMVFKMWMFDKETDDRLVPVVPCVCGPIVPEDTFEQFMNRSFDVMFIGNPCPQRVAACGAVLRSRIHPSRVKIEVYSENRPYPINDWMNLHRQSKMFLETGAGAQGSARPVELGTASLLLRQRDRISWPFEWKHLTSCIEIGEPLKPVTPWDINCIMKIIEDDEFLYKLYLQCRQATLQFTPERMASYIMGMMIDKLGAQ